MANQKLTQEELQAIAQLQQQTQTATMELGNIELLKISLETRRTNALSLLEQVRENEQKLVSSLQAKYGDGSIDLKTGEFIPVQQPAPVMPVLEKAE